jgi:HIRAN domain
MKFFKKSANSKIGYEIDKGEAFNYEVVGESFARDNLTQIIRGKESIGEFLTTAILRPEPTNQFDPNAVEVLIEGKHVGYIPKHDSEEVTKFIKKSGPTMETPARIGWDTDNPMPLIGVTITLNF